MLNCRSNEWTRAATWKRVARCPLWFGLALSGSAACSDATDHSDCGSAYGGETSLMTWWRLGETAEGSAQQKLLDGYLTCSGGTVRVESAEGDKEAALRINEIEEKHLLLVNGLSDIDRLHCTADRGTGLFALHDLDSIKWRDRIPGFLMPYVKPCGGEDQGRLFAVPIGLHSLNRIIVASSHAAALTAKGLTPQAFLEWLQAQAASGMPKPIVIPDNIEPSFLLVENIMVAVAGDRYREFWNMNRNTQSPNDIDMTPFQTALDYADALLPYIEYVAAADGQDALTRTMSRVCNGGAALTIQADWLDAADSCDGLVAAPFPGTAGYDVFSFDAFAVDHSRANEDPKSPAFLARGSSEYAWLKAATSLQVQTQYADEKHSRVLVKLDGNGNSVALDDDEVFAPDVTPLPGLLLVVKHSSFERFGSEIDDYFKHHPADPNQRSVLKSKLVTYVHNEMCELTSCKPTPVR